jgi:hypothetical protein
MHSDSGRETILLYNENYQYVIGDHLTIVNSAEALANLSGSDRYNSNIILYGLGLVFLTGTFMMILYFVLQEISSILDTGIIEFDDLLGGLAGIFCFGYLWIGSMIGFKDSIRIEYSARILDRMVANKVIVVGKIVGIENKHINGGYTLTYSFLHPRRGILKDHYKSLNRFRLSIGSSVYILLHNNYSVLL